jgi:hypothetical protein
MLHRRHAECPKHSAATKAIFHSRLVASDLARDPRFVPSLSRQRNSRINSGWDASGQESARKSHAFKILTYKIFVMNILQGISPVKASKLLILDILGN